MSKTMPIIDHHLGTMSCASRLYSTFWKFLIRMKNENSTCLINLIKGNFYVPWLIRVHQQDFQGKRQQQHCQIIFPFFFSRRPCAILFQNMQMIKLEMPKAERSNFITLCFWYLLPYWSHVYCPSQTVMHFLQPMLSCKIGVFQCLDSVQYTFYILTIT